MANKTIVIIEDNVINREGVAIVLRKAGYRALPFPEGKAALEYLRSHDLPDLILLDMVIPPPGCDGWWLLEQLKLSPILSQIPVFITTGLSVASEEWAASLGARGLFRKPVDVEPLLAEIQRRLAG